MEYYIISLKHTSKADSALTLWRADCCGYCWFKEWAGVYTEPELPSLTDGLNIAINKDYADKWFQPTTYDGETRMVIPNFPNILQALNLDIKLMKPKKSRSCYMSF